MLACQHGGKTTAAELLSASSRLRSARPVARPNIREAVVHEEENSRRRYRRHTRKTADVVARGARISFGAANGAGTIYRKTRGNCTRLEIRRGIHWFSRGRAQQTNRPKSKAFGEGLDRVQFWPGAWHTGASDQRRGNASARQLPWRRTHALSGTRNRLGLRARLGENSDAA